jgi:hypothetical protein
VLNGRGHVAMLGGGDGSELSPGGKRVFSFQKRKGADLRAGSGYAGLKLVNGESLGLECMGLCPYQFHSNPSL